MLTIRSLVLTEKEVIVKMMKMTMTMILVARKRKRVWPDRRVILRA